LEGDVSSDGGGLTAFEKGVFFADLEEFWSSAGIHDRVILSCDVSPGISLMDVGDTLAKPVE